MGEQAAQLREAYRLEAEQYEQLLTTAQQIALSGLEKVISVESWIHDEEYSHSLRLHEQVGGDLENGNDSLEAQARRGLLRENMFSSVIEMLHTDRESRAKLENNRERKYPVHGGHVISQDGKETILQLCINGAEKSKRRALLDPRMVPVAERTAADVLVAKIVDGLPIGGVHFSFSNYLKEAMDRHGSKFYDALGNRQFLGFIQWYYRLDERTMLTGSYSVDPCDIDNVRAMWQKFGGHIPEGLETPTWTAHGITRFDCTEAEARQTVLSMRKDFYERRGLAHVKRYSVDEFLALNRAAADEMFQLNLDLSRSYYRHRKSASIQAMVDGLLENPKGLNHEVREQLHAIQQNDEFNRDGASLVEQLIRYATAERLRVALKKLGTGEAPVVNTVMTAGSTVEQLAFLARQSAGNILDGARAGRTYGGCTMSINLSENPDSDSSVEEDPQEAFGGRGVKRGDKESGTEICDYKHRGCYCCPYGDNGEPLAEPMEVMARKRPGLAKCLRPNCNAFMILDKEGNPKAIYKGNIYQSAQTLAAKKEKVAQDLAKREEATRAMATTVLQPRSISGLQDRLAVDRQRLEMDRETNEKKEKVTQVA